MAGIGSAPGILVGFGVGAAASAALEPAFEIPRQEAWLRNPNRVLDPGILARLVAEGGVPLGEAQDEAKRHGYDSDKFDRLVYAAQNVPGVAELMFLWRLGIIDKPTWKQGMVKLGQRPDFIDHVAQTFSVPLTAEQVAIAVHRSVIQNQGQLPDLPPVGPGKVPRYPEPNIDAYKSAEAYGVGTDQLDALARSLGLPPGMDLVARAVFRGILDRNDFDLAAAQSNRRREWAGYEFDAYRHILTPVEYTELQLRGFSDRAARLADTDKWGMSHDDSDKLYDVLGRAPALHAVVVGLARGGKYPGSYANVPEPYRSAIQRSNIREEWSEVVYAGRYSYPSAFVLRSLAQAGDLGDTAAVEQILHEIGWPPSLAKQVAAKWVPTGSAVDANVKKAHTTAWSKAQASYIAEESTAADVAPIFDLLGVTGQDRTDVLKAWDAIRALTRKQLTPAQVVKAVKEGVTNPATNLPWSHADGLAALEARGYSTADATTLLSE